MEPSSYPPPPPSSVPPTASRRTKGFHGPATNLFLGIRRQLASVETSSQLPIGKAPTIGLLCSLIIAATGGLGLSLVVQLPILAAVGLIPVTVFFAPLTEEPLKALGMLIVLFLLWKLIPNRRYGAALGAAAGLGFGFVFFCIGVFQPSHLELAHYRSQSCGDGNLRDPSRHLDHLPSVCDNPQIHLRRT